MLKIKLTSYINMSSDRHKNIRTYKSGAQKRKATLEKNKTNEEILAKTPKLSTFFTVTTSSKTNDENHQSISETNDKPLPHSEKSSTEEARQETEKKTL